MIDRPQKTILIVLVLLVGGVVATFRLVSAQRGARAASAEAPWPVDRDVPSDAQLVSPGRAEAATDADPVRELVAGEAAREPRSSSVLLRGRLREHVHSDEPVFITVAGVWGEGGVLSEVERMAQPFWPASAEVVEDRTLRAHGQLPLHPGDENSRLGWDGSFELDVTDLFWPGRPDTLSVEAESDGRLGWTAAPVGEVSATDAGPHVIEVVVDLDQPREVTGEVHPSKDARVAAFHLVDGVLARHAAGHADVRPDGSFRMALPVANSFVVVAYAKGLRPSSREWHLGFERSGYLPAFHLDRGATIGGSVSLGGRTVCATVTAVTEQRDSRGFVAGRDELFLIDGRFEWGATSARAESDGDFELSGLAPGEYTVNVSGVSLGDGATVGRLPTSTATAPAVGLDLSPDAACVRLEFLGDLAALAETGYALEQDFGSAGKTLITVRPNARGLAQLWLSPTDPVRGIGTSLEFLPRDCASGPPCVVDTRGE
jgi:hypothetical protein